MSPPKLCSLLLTAGLSQACSEPLDRDERDYDEWTLVQICREAEDTVSRRKKKEMYRSCLRGVGATVVELKDDCQEEAASKYLERLARCVDKFDEDDGPSVMSCGYQTHADLLDSKYCDD